MADSTYTTDDLRQTLLDTIEDLRAGTIETKKAVQVANLAEKVIRVSDLELRYADLRVKLSDKTTNPDDIQPGHMILAVTKQDA